MRYSADIHHRRSMRLQGYDYASAGAYFVTICTYEKRCVFEDLALRAVAEEVWVSVVGSAGPADEFVIMPNHVHGIIWIANPDVVGARQHERSVQRNRRRSDHTTRFASAGDVVASPPRLATAPPPGSLGAIVGSFKAATAKRINNMRGSPGAPVWQRNYYEHIIRDEADLARIRQYIRDNPARWDEDEENPMNVSG